MWLAENCGRDPSKQSNLGVRFLEAVPQGCIGQSLDHFGTCGMDFGAVHGACGSVPLSVASGCEQALH